MLKNKKRGHELYSINRKEDYFINVTHIIESTNKNSAQEEFISAIRNGDIDSVCFLLMMNKIDVNQFDNHQMTPINHASVCSQVQIAKCLLSAGVEQSINIKDRVCFFFFCSVSFF